MLFNSIEFIYFFLAVYILYLLLNHKWQNVMLLVASYVFYGAWNWKFLSLIAISTLVDYFCGLKIYEEDNKTKRKALLFISIATNLLILGIFKYFNFFSSSLQSLVTYLGLPFDPKTLSIILPVGISFYTFQSMSYTIDIYKGEVQPTRKLTEFALFVAYFPQLVAGPIERAKNLLPQILSERQMNWGKFSDGCFLILWGFFQKVFVADNLGRLVGPVFQYPSLFDGSVYLVAVYGFAFQIYCDFAGYSNIARGLSKCMGIDIMINFNFPYFSSNPTDFWRRWHISLSTWLRDYLYIPLGGNRKGGLCTIRNLALTMLLGGLWHGAAWTFVVWGAYHGILLIVYRILNPIMRKLDSLRGLILRNFVSGVKVIIFFHLVCMGWLLFRAESLTQAYNMLLGIFYNFNWNENPQLATRVNFLIKHIWFLLIMDVIGFKMRSQKAISFFPGWLQVLICLGLYLSITFHWGTSDFEFIYFQF